MSHSRPIDKLGALDGASSDLTLRNFAGAAALANLIVATMVFAEFSVIALAKHEPETFRLGLWLVPFVTVVIWVSTAVFYLLAVAWTSLGTLGRRLVGRHRSLPSARSGVWDEWLDRPLPHDR